MTSLATAARPTAPLHNATGKGITLIGAQILPVMAVVSLFPAIPRLFEQFGSHPHAGLLVPMIVTIPSLFVALCAPFAGSIADRFGRRPIFLAALAVYTFVGILPLLLDNLYLIVASRAVLGMAEASIVTISSALIGDYFREDRHRWVAWVGVFISLAGTLLVAAGGALADISWRGPFAIYALALPLLVLAVIFIEEPDRNETASDPAARDFPWRAAAVIGSITIIASVLYYVEPLHVASVLVAKGAGSATHVGLIQSATSLAYIAGAFLYRRIHGLSVGVILGIAGALIGAGLMIISLAPTHVGVAVGATIQQFGSGLVIPVLLAWGQSMLPTEQRARGMGIWATAFFAGLFICPPLVGIGTAMTGGLQGSLLFFGGLTIVMAILSALFFRGPRAIH